MKAGTIYKISIKDFVTYSDVVMYPGPNLNVVIGPNGTGKSTIVAAIILGLGGTPKTIGRGTKVSEYVKHECSESKINIELYGPNAGIMYSVTRVFNLNNHNVWYLNNKQVNEIEIKNTVLKLNIQVNNLCQFLPQDRVQDFAKMDKKELLVNTQKAIGRQDLVDKHAELINLKNKQKEIAHDLDQLTTKLNQAREDVSRLEGKVQNLKEKKKIKEEIDCIKRKICWENYNKALKTKKTVEKDMKQAQAIVNKHSEHILPVTNKIKALRNFVRALQDQLQQTRNSLGNLEAKVKKLLEKAEDIDRSHNDITIEMRSKLHNLATFQNEIDAIKVKIDKLSNDENSLINQYGEESIVEGNAEKLRKGATAYQTKCDELNRQRVTVLNVLKRSGEHAKQLEEKLQVMENVTERRLQNLLRRDQDSYRASMWLKENRHIFKGNVYYPSMVELNVLDPKNSKYLENIIPMRERVAFTCELREDMNTFLRHVRDGMGLKINVVHSGADHPSLASLKPNMPIEQLRKFGFFAYASTLITGPEPVVKYMCRMYQMHNIPVGDKNTNVMAPQVPDQFKLFFSDSHRYSVNSSRYTGQKSTRISNVESDGTFSICVDMNSMTRIRQQLEELNEEQQKMQVKVNEFEAQKQAYENKRGEILRERTSLLQQKEQIKGLRDKRIVAQRTLQQYLQNHKTAEQIKEEGSRKIKAVIENASKIHKSILASIIDLTNEIKKEKQMNLELTVNLDEITYLDNQAEDLRSEFHAAKTTLNEIIAVFTTATQDVEETLRAAKKLSEGFAPTDRGFGKFRAKHDELSDNLDTLSAKICELQTKMECILTADDGELKQFEQGQKMLSLCQEEIVVKEGKMKELSESIESVYKEWVEPLQDMVEKINKNFGTYFESMQCSGEVSLSFDTPSDYISYGLTIRVTYRTAEPLQELNRYVQSGGERAVATAVYMLAMQDLTAVPFRCVDEINQGMDPQNERRIFEILVQVAGRMETGQYFLITPKLIAALKFKEAMKIHIVHNGAFCELGKNFRITDFLKKR